MAFARRINAGQLRHRIYLQTLSSTQDTSGQYVDSWSNTATLWARVEPMTGRELESAQQITESVTTKVTIRPRQIFPNQRFLVPKDTHNTTLAAAISGSTTTSMSVSTAIGPQSGDFDVRLGSEFVSVQSGNGTTDLTMNRSQYGTTASTSHASGAVARWYEPLYVESAINPDERGVLMECMCGSQR